METVIVADVPTAIGSLGAVITAQGLARLGFHGEPVEEREAWLRRWLPLAQQVDDGEPLSELQAQLDAYFAGLRRRFDIALDMRGTPFQLRVWRELLNIPFGEVRSYLQVATAIGQPTATRAVGAANGRNYIPIIVPCHRVIGSDGTLTGFGGGLALKQRLLELEGIRLGGQRAEQQVALPL
jgi:O-6-methylguanine DNA methyltransferase